MQRVSELVRRLHVYGIRHVHQVPRVRHVWLCWLWASLCSYGCILGYVLGTLIAVFLSAICADFVESLFHSRVQWWVMATALGVYGLCSVLWFVRRLRTRKAKRAHIARREEFLSSLAFHMLVRLDPSREVSFSVSPPRAENGVLSVRETKRSVGGWSMHMQTHEGGTQRLQVRVTRSDVSVRMVYIAPLRDEEVGVLHPASDIPEDVSWVRSEGWLVHALHTCEPDDRERVDELVDAWVAQICRHLAQRDPSALATPRGRSVSRLRGAFGENVPEPPAFGFVKDTVEVWEMYDDDALKTQRSWAYIGWAGRVLITCATAGILVLCACTYIPMSGIYLAVLSLLALCSMSMTRDIAQALGRSVVWNRTPLLPRFSERGVLWLEGSICSTQHATVECARPFHVIWTRDETEDGEALLGVELVQANEGNLVERLVFEVPVERSLWWENLPQLSRFAVRVDGVSFDTWLLPALLFYLHLHGDEIQPVAYTHRARAEAT